MHTLIVPCAGSRQIDSVPLFLQMYPDRQILALKAIEGIFPHQYDRIIFSILKQDDLRFNAREKILAANNGKYNVEFVVLDTPTNGPAETVYKTLIMGNVVGEFAVRDSHAYIKIEKYYSGNFCAGLDLTQYEKPIDNLRTKSFIKVNEQGHLLDVVEKHFYSDIISAGFYGFKSVDEYKKAYERLSDSNYGIKKLYISHIISYMIGYYQRVFYKLNVLQYEDWSTVSAWKKVQNRNSICFVDLDDINLTEEIITKMQKLSKEGVSFIGFSCLDVTLSDYDIKDINMLTVIGNCPKTQIKSLASNIEDLDRLILEV